MLGAALLMATLLSRFSAPTLEITSIENSSNYFPSKTGSWDVMGGTAGASISCGGEPGTIDSCRTGKGRSACNFRVICPTTQLTIHLKANVSGDLVLADWDGVLHDFGHYESGDSTTARLSWSEICNDVSSDATCATNGTRLLRLGIRPSGSSNLVAHKGLNFGISGMADGSAAGSFAGIDGVADYWLLPRHKGAVVKTFSVVQDYFVLDMARIVAVRGFYSAASCATPLAVTTASDSYALRLNDDQEIVSRRISGLEDGVRYLFMFGFEDKAGNVGLFKDLTIDCEDDKHSVVPHGVWRHN